ncbi:MAG: ribonuclease HII [Oscillospiraceae bacterium]|nr:ribonuclease HII [Oscillospiraceae bacterium]
MNDLYGYDKGILAEHGIFCGIDEAGRGPLAGDVYAAAVIIPEGVVIDGVNDSKKLTERQRDLLYDEITARTVWSVGIATVAEIEEINILRAALLAMKRAYEGLSQRPGFALIDGNKLPSLDIPCQCVVKGDGTSAAIACASIVAKVSRDRYMAQMAEKYPEWQFGRHKGYGTKLHYEMIDKFGESPIHRHSFLRKYYEKKTD